MQSQNTISVAFCLWIHRYTCVFSHNQSTKKGLDFFVLRSTFHDELTYCQQITCFIVSTPMCCFFARTMAHAMYHTSLFLSHRESCQFLTLLFFCVAWLLQQKRALSFTIRLQRSSSYLTWKRGIKKVLLGVKCGSVCGWCKNHWVVETENGFLSP